MKKVRSQPLCRLHIYGASPDQRPFFEPGCPRCELKKRQGLVTGKEPRPDARSMSAMKYLRPLNLVLILFAAFSSCGHLFSTALRSRADVREDAIRVVWRDAFGRKDEPPQVIELTGKFLNCANAADPTDHGFLWSSDEGKTFDCLGGLAFPDKDILFVSHNGPEPWSATSLAHELCHIHFYRDHGQLPVEGKDHENGCYTGHDGLPPLTDVANHLLRLKGL